jgi:non-ribosomal peptide synthetase component F
MRQREQVRVAAVVLIFFSDGRDMKDGIQLLAAAAVFATIAWIFWHFLGNGGVRVISAVALLLLVADNIRLRHTLKVEQRR